MPIQLTTKQVELIIEDLDRLDGSLSDYADINGCGEPDVAMRAQMEIRSIRAKLRGWINEFGKP